MPRSDRQPDQPAPGIPAPGRRAAPEPRCPICGKPASRTPEAGGKVPFPFCSDRCRLIDLGRWLDGAYQIPAEEEAPPEPPRDTEEE